MNFLQRIFRKQSTGGEEGYPVSQLTGKRLNPLYKPGLKRCDFDMAEKEMDLFMRSHPGYRKLIEGQDIPRPKRRFLRKEERMEVGDVKTMARISKF